MVPSTPARRAYSAAKSKVFSRARPSRSASYSAWPTDADGASRRRRVGALGEHRTSSTGFGGKLDLDHRHVAVRRCHRPAVACLPGRAACLPSLEVDHEVTCSKPLWLGHESTNTTHRYVEANLEMMEKGTRAARGARHQARALPRQRRLYEVPADPVTMQSAATFSMIVDTVDSRAGCCEPTHG